MSVIAGRLVYCFRKTSSKTLESFEFCFLQLFRFCAKIFLLVVGDFEYSDLSAKEVKNQPQ